MGWTHYPINIKVRLLSSFFNRMVTSAVMPFMALYFAHELSKVWAGLFLMATVFLGFLMNLIGGYISDRFHRKKVLILTSFSSAVMFILMTLSLIPRNNLIVLFALSYVGLSVASSIGRPSMNALIIDSTTKENRKEIYALDYWLTNLSLAIGAALGGLLYSEHKLLLFTVLSATSTAIPIAYLIWLQDSTQGLLKKVHNNVVRDVVANYSKALRDSDFVKVVGGSLCIFAAEFSMNSYIGVRLADTFTPIMLGDFRIDGVRMLSFLNIENMLLVVCLAFVANRLSNRWPPKNVLIIGLLLYGIGYSTITFANSFILLITFSFLATIGELLYSPIRNAEQANMIPDDKRGSYSALANVSFSGADLVARFSIVLGAFLLPAFMSLYIGIIIMSGALLLYSGLYVRTTESERLKKVAIK
ncbi:permease [Fictibacillus macauensis ZFHKF-1]|uniref:Permease n=1 Tax=Fictibacillus macauensis ZFHKF-1 TaxID=1196324 RepID=I8AK14_9BACL|nr:MFS transporter [Fictibacillus macauensis]EIT86152.1 permease [Fictibacillus macauensis ZFHKF-1]